MKSESIASKSSAASKVKRGTLPTAKERKSRARQPEAQLEKPPAADQLVEARQMRAVRLSIFGGPETLRVEEMAAPLPADDEVLLRVHVAGINPVDAKIRAGDFPRFHPRLPAVIGRDVSGVVVQIGRNAVGFREGNEVFGMLDYDRGAYAEYAVASAKEITFKPPLVAHPTAAAIPVAALTAWQALFDHGRLQRGQRVLIHGAGGGVGHFAVQFGRWSGAHVIAVCAAEDLDFVRDLGAEEAIDYRAENLEYEAHGVDLVIDLVGGEARRRSWELLNPGGILVSTLPAPIPEGRSDVSGREVVVYPSSRRLNVIGSLVAAGVVKVVIEKMYPLAEASEAHRRMENEHSRGKMVLLMD
jgi:NADPH:quinone reductase-like Zn-dependent oxidoreductase